MSNPADKSVDTQEEQDQDTGSSFADLVNKAVNEAKTDEKGNLVLPDDLSEEVKYAATLEKRRRDTQASHTKISQRVKALEAEKSTLISKATGSFEVELTAEQEAELDDLKFSNPEAWRKKMNTLETEARNKRTKEIDEELKKVSSSSLEAEELERRKQVLSDFIKANEGFELDDDIIANDIPPRISKKLEAGQITFEEFLQECYGYLKTGKVIKQDKVPSGPNLSKVGGGNSPDKNAVKEDIITSYTKETY
jgi:hypothetical protein